jgi:iron complex outermembrane receptor protein
MKRKSLLILAAISTVAALGSAQRAAPTTAADENTEGALQVLAPITVTGYVVPRIGEGPQPVLTLDQDFMQRQADQTVAQVLQRLPENSASINQMFDVGNSFTPGAASANLRGLGANSTLVLIDGHRQVAFPFFNNGTESFVDLNSIPLAAVERIEVLKDGASATYGSDAIAGVVNIILKDQYQGADLSLHYGISQRGDAEEYHAQLVGGISQELSENSKLSMVAAFDYYEQGPIDSADRSYALIEDHQKFGSFFDNRSFRAPNGNFTDAAGNIYAVNPGVTGPKITPSDFTITPGTNPLFNLFNFAPYGELLPRSQRYGGYLKLNYEPTQWLKFYDEFSYQHNEETNQQAPLPVSSTDGITVPAANPFNPFGIPLSVFGMRMNELGPRKVSTTIDTLRNLAGLTIQLPKNWFIDATFLYAQSNADSENFNFTRNSALNAALNGTLPGLVGQFYNPFTDENIARPNSQFLNALRYTTSDKPRTDLSIWAIKAGGELFDLPSGPVILGLGLEYRNDSYLDIKDRASEIQDVVASGGAGGAGKRYVESAYGELTIPILGGSWSWPGARVLEVVLAERVDKYSDFGSAWKPKISLRYKPFNDLTFRATYAESFRAPSLSELFHGELIEFQQLTDPKTGLTADYEVHSFGNPNLKPEDAYSYYAGMIWTPGAQDPEHSWWGWANGFTAYVDWTEINKRGAIQLEDLNTVLANEDRAPGSVVRNPNGTINFINDPFVNVGAVRIDALDFGFSYVTKEFYWGKVDFELNATYTYNFKQQFLIPGTVFDYTDTFNLPDFKMTASIFYSKKLLAIDTFQTGFTLNYIDSEHDTSDDFRRALPSSFAQPNGLVHRIGSWTTVDWQISYNFGDPAPATPEMPHPGYGEDGKKIIGEQAISPKPEGSSRGIRQLLANTKFTFGINNIGDVRPPFADVAEGYDTLTTNPIGRFFYVDLEKKF